MATLIEKFKTIYNSSDKVWVSLKDILVNFIVDDSTIRANIIGNISGVITTDTINEKTAGSGVTIDSTLIKDGVVTANLIGDVTGNVTGNLVGKITVTKASVTQAGSISTAVTLDTPSGIITTIATYAITAGSNVAFTVNNASCFSTSVIVTGTSVVTDIPPVVTVETIADASFVIRLYNVSDVNITSGQIAIHFMIL